MAESKTLIRGHAAALAILADAKFGVVDGVIETLPESAKEEESVKKVAEMIAEKVNGSKPEAAAGKGGKA